MVALQDWCPPYPPPPRGTVEEQELNRLHRSGYMAFWARFPDSSHAERDGFGYQYLRAVSSRRTPFSSGDATAYLVLALGPWWSPPGPGVRRRGWCRILGHKRERMPHPCGYGMADAWRCRRCRAAFPGFKYPPAPPMPPPRSRGIPPANEDR